jgi:hypothetical protein
VLCDARNLQRLGSTRNAGEMITQIGMIETYIAELQLVKAIVLPRDSTPEQVSQVWRHESMTIESWISGLPGIP